MKQVSREAFYEAIGQMDVTLSVQGNYPYKTIFRLRSGELVGVEDGGYFLTEAALGGGGDG